MKLFLKFTNAVLLLIAAPLLHAKPMVIGITNDSPGILRQNVSLRIKASATQTHEPSRFVLLGSGLLGFAGLVRRKFLQCS